MGIRIKKQTGSAIWRQPQAIARPCDKTTVLQWLLFILLIGVVLLFPDRPAWSSGFYSDVTSTGSCFVSATLTEFGGLSLLFGFCIMTTLYGLRLIIRSTGPKK